MSGGWEQGRGAMEKGNGYLSRGSGVYLRWWRWDLVRFFPQQIRGEVGGHLSRNCHFVGGEGC